MIKTKTENSFTQRMLGAVDLAIDFATLGEYGLEPIDASRGDDCRERRGHMAGWEALATARRRGCVRVQRNASGRVRRLHELGQA